MKFKVGDKVLVNTPDPTRRYYGVVSMVLDPDEGAYLIKDGKDSTREVHALNLNMLPDEDEEPNKLKMEFALEQNFKEVMKHIEDGTHRLVSQEMQHDYDKRDKEHVISINLILKENE